MGLLNTANRILRPIGIELSKASRGGAGFTQYSYARPDGSIDYERYKSVQTDGNKRKIDQVFADESNIAVVSDYIKERMTPSFGLCHGTRRGVEQAWFSQRLGCPVLGTEISDTAKDFPNTLQWDFHDVKPEWVGAVDFIYSNSLDHSFDPSLALTAWMSCLKPTGLCFLEHTSRHTGDHADELDPFGVDLKILPYLIATWSKGRYGVVDIISGSDTAKRSATYLVVRPATA